MVIIAVEHDGMIMARSRGTQKKIETLDISTQTVADVCDSEA